MKKVYIAGVGQTKFGELWSESVESLSQMAANEALVEAKMEANQIEAIFVGNMLLQQLEQRAQVGKVIAEAVGLTCPAFHLEAACASGGMAITTAVNALWAGVYDTVMVVGAEKMTDVATEVITRALMGAGSEQEQLQGVTFPALYGMLTREYMDKFKVSDRELAVFPVLAHEQAKCNPLAQFHQQITVETVMKSGMVADPIRLLNASPVSDGAAAIILTTKSLTHGVIISGSAVGGDRLDLALRESWTSMAATKKAVIQALKQAEVTIDKVKTVEVHDCFSVAEAMALEDLGFCAPGTSSEWIKHTKVKVNPSGGLKGCGHPVGATGVKQVVEVYRQLNNKTKSKYGVCQNVGGTGATAVVQVLKKETE